MPSCAARMPTASFNARVPVQLGHMGLQGVTGRVIDLLAHLVDPALSAHTVSMSDQGTPLAAVSVV